MAQCPKSPTSVLTVPLLSSAYSHMKVKVKLLSRFLPFATPWTIQPVEFSRPEYWSGQPFCSPGDRTNLGIKPRSLHCRQILYQLSHKGSPRILEWVAYLFSRRRESNLPNPGIKPGSPALQVDSLPTELLGKPHNHLNGP